MPRRLSLRHRGRREPPSAATLLPLASTAGPGEASACPRDQDLIDGQPPATRAAGWGQRRPRRRAAAAVARLYARSRAPWGPLVRRARHNRALMWLAGWAMLLVIFVAVLPVRARLVFWRGLEDNAALAGITLIFSLLSLSLVWSTGQRVDAWAFMALNVRGPRPRWLDGVMLAFTQLGNGLASFLIALLYWSAGLHLFAYQLVLGTVTLWLMVELVKALARRRRPYLRLPGARLVGRRPLGRSFPSGHTSQAFFLATVLVQHFHADPLLMALLYALALLVGLTRIYVGAHYPRDVLAGAILGTTWGFLGALVEGYSWLRVA